MEFFYSVPSEVYLGKRLVTFFAPKKVFFFFFFLAHEDISFFKRLKMKSHSLSYKEIYPSTVLSWVYKKRNLTYKLKSFCSVCIGYVSYYGFANIQKNLETFVFFERLGLCHTLDMQNP